MLDGLSQVPWAELEHAYGCATDVPELIRSLLASDPTDREQARWELYGNIFHQGTRYEASAFAVPFLLELLEDPATPDRAEILGLLASLAIGYDEVWLPNGVQKQQLQQMFEPEEVAVYEAVRCGVPLYQGLLADADPRIRALAAYTLAWFTMDAATSVPALAPLAADTHPSVAATALVAIGLIGSAKDLAAVRTAESALAGEDRAVVRWGAAVALAQLLGRAAEAPVPAELLAWTSGDSSCDDEIPYLDGDLAGYAGLALRQLGDANIQAAFDALLARIPAINGPEALPIVGEALRYAFPAGQITSGTRFADLDQRAQQLLRVLADSPSTWKWGEFGTFGNFCGLLTGYGLPGDVDELQSFVATLG